MKVLGNLLQITGPSANLGVGITPTYGLHVLGGSTRIQALATPAAPTVTPTGTIGSTSYTYYIVAIDRNGYKTLPSPAGTTTTGNATLNGTNYNAISWVAVPGAVNYDILSGNTSTALATGITTTSINDIGQVTTAYSSPLRNTTADLTVDGQIANVGMTNVPNTFTVGPQTFQTGTAINKGLIVQAAISQSTNLQEWQSATGTILVSIAASGNLSLLGPSANLGLGISPAYGLHQLGGSARLQALTTPAAPTIITTGTVGTTSYTYYIVATDRNGNRTLPSPAGTTTTGNATLNTTNYNAISWTAVSGAVSYDILKGNTTTSLATVVIGTSFNDTGQATIAYTAPTRNTTSDLTVDGQLIVNSSGTIGAMITTGGEFSNPNPLGGTGAYNERFGLGALRSNTTGTSNVAFGYTALYYNTTGQKNAAFGYQSLVNNTTGTYDSGFGFGSLLSNTIGSENSAFGFCTSYSNTSGGYNTAVGYEALYFNQIGSYNCAVGGLSLVNATSNNNSAFGYRCLVSATTGASNTGMGYQALSSLTTGSSNVGAGYNAGNGVTTGTNNTFLGYSAGSSAGASTVTNATAIGYNAQVTASNTLILGQTGASSPLVGINTTAPAAQLHVIPASATTKGIIVQAATSQTANLQQWQNSSGTILTYIDSAGHYYFAGGTPTIVAGVGAGTTPTITITGSDQAGSISITTGTTPTAAAVLATITFGFPFGTAPRAVNLTPGTATALNAAYISNITTTTFVLSSGSTALSASTTYIWYYAVWG